MAIRTLHKSAQFWGYIALGTGVSAVNTYYLLIAFQSLQLLPLALVMGLAIPALASLAFVWNVDDSRTLLIRYAWVLLSTIVLNIAIMAALVPALLVSPWHIPLLFAICMPLGPLLFAICMPLGMLNNIFYLVMEDIQAQRNENQTQTSKQPPANPTTGHPCPPLLGRGRQLVLLLIGHTAVALYTYTLLTGVAHLPIQLALYATLLGTVPAALLALTTLIILPAIMDRPRHNEVMGYIYRYIAPAITLLSIATTIVLLSTVWSAYAPGVFLSHPAILPILLLLHLPVFLAPLRNFIVYLISMTLAPIVECSKHCLPACCLRPSSPSPASSNASSKRGSGHDDAFNPDLGGEEAATGSAKPT